MQCVLLFMWVVLAAGQQNFRYDGTVVDQSRLQSNPNPIFTLPQPQPQPSVMEPFVFVEPQPVFVQSGPSQPDFLPLRQAVSRQQTSVIVDPQQGFSYSHGLSSPRELQHLPSMPFQPQFNIVPKELPFIDERAMFVSQHPPAPRDVFVSLQSVQPQPSVFEEPPVLISRQPESTIFVQPQPAVASRPGLVSPRPVLGSNFAVQTGCDPVAHHLVDQVIGSDYWHFSWCHQPGRTFTWHQAQDYCSSLGYGFHPVSIENQLKDNYVTAVMSAHRKTIIWTSGNRLRTALWSWSTGVSSQYTNWSNTGSLGLPQPDNAEGNEFCLAVRYSYSDGARWHDEPCTSSYLVICQSNDFA